MNRSSVMPNDRRQSAFEVYLRTGRRDAGGRRQDVEVKFNPWHDPEDGRFTFSGRGRYYGAGASVEATGGAGRSGQWQRGARIDSADPDRSEEHTSELQSLMRHSYDVFCLQSKITQR